MDKMLQIIDFLSRYTQVSEDERQAMAGFMHFASIPKNETLLKQGEISKRAAFLIKGVVRSYYIDEKGVEHTISFTFENEPLMEMHSFFNQVPSASYVITLAPTELIYTSYEEFFQFLDRFPRYESVIRKIVSEDMALESEHARLLRISSSRERYEAFCKLRPDVLQRVPLKYIASYLEMAIETLSRVRAGKL